MLQTDAFFKEIFTGTAANYHVGRNFGAVSQPDSGCGTVFNENFFDNGSVGDGTAVAFDICRKRLRKLLTASGEVSIAAIVVLSFFYGNAHIKSSFKSI